MKSEWTRLVRTVAPDPVVTLVEAKKHLRILHSDDDEEILDIIAAAQAQIEGPNGIGIALAPQTWRMSLDYFPCEIIVPLGPVTAINSITYTKEDGTAGSTDRWRVDIDSQPCRLWPPYDESWPVSRCEPGAVKVTFTTGYASVPADLRAAVKLLVGHLYENREATTDASMTELPMAVSSILNRYRVGRVA